MDICKSNDSPSPPDLVSLAVVRQGLAAIADEMTLVVMRAARSPALREAGDLSSALTDERGGVIAQGRDLPIHLGVMTFTVKELLQSVGAHAMRDGDVWIVNHALVGGNHLPDVKLIRPIFHGGALVAFAASLAHWADVGGGAPGSYLASATDSWQEGLQIPPVRVMQDNRVVHDIVAVIKANVRGEQEREGDMLAQLAALTVADQRVKELIARVGIDAFGAALAGIRSVSAAQMRKVIASLPDGRYQGEDFVDDDGRGGGPVRVAVDIEVAGESIEFDFSRSADAINAPLNTTPFVTMTGVLYLLKAIARDEVYHSDGALAPIRVITRRGSLLDPGPGYPVVGGNHETSQRVVDAIVKALGAAIPERLCAGGSGSGGLLIFAGKRGDGSWWTFYETHGGGEGGHSHRDGASATRVHLANMANTPTEFIEAEYPIQVLRAALRDGSGGRGAHRGGDGLIREYRCLADDIVLTTMFERGVVPPYGLQGGEDGLPFRVTLVRGGEHTTLTGCHNQKLQRDDVIRLESAGGGGYGPFE